MKFYRYEAVEYAEHDQDGELVSPRFPNPKVELREFNLFRETPKGYWIGYGYPNGLHDKGRWVSKTAKKRFAYPTKEEALTNFIKRTERRVEIMNRQLTSCRIALITAKNMKI